MAVLFVGVLSVNFLGGYIFLIDSVVTLTTVSCRSLAWTLALARIGVTIVFLTGLSRTTNWSFFLLWQAGKTLLIWQHFGKVFFSADQFCTWRYWF